MRSIRSLAVVGLAIAAGALGVAGPASAAPARSAANATSGALRITVVRTAMTVTGFDRKVAAAHGYEVRTAGDGRTYLAGKGSARRASTAGVVPYNVVSGNCGYSYVYEYGIGNRAIELYTGYSVIHDVLRWHWQVRLDDRGGSSYKNWSGWINNGIWQVDVVVGGLTRGGARALVIPSNSWTLLDTGSICHSGGPSDTTTIT